MLKILLAIIALTISGMGYSADGRVTGLKVKDGKLTGSVIGTDPIGIQQVQVNGDTVLTVPDDGGGSVASCPDGGNVCSGGTTSTACTNLGGNVASCTYDLEWMRVGNRISIGVHGFADPNADVYSTWTINPLPGVSAGFPADAGRGSCTWGYSTTLTTGLITAEVGQTRTRVEFRNTPGLDSRAWGCTIVYQVSP